MAGTVDSVAEAVLARHSAGPLAPRPTVLAGVSGSEWGETVIARAVVLAAEDDADLLVIHVNLGDRLSRRQAEALERYRVMTLGADGRYAEVDGTNAADALAETARDRRATRVVVARHRARLGELVRGSVASRVRRLVPGAVVDEVRREKEPATASGTMPSLDS